MHERRARTFGMKELDHDTVKDHLKSSKSSAPDDSSAPSVSSLVPPSTAGVDAAGLVVAALDLVGGFVGKADTAFCRI